MNLISPAQQEERERQWLERAGAGGWPSDRIEAGLYNLRSEYQHSLWAHSPEAQAARVAAQAASLANECSELTIREVQASDWQSQAGLLARIYLTAYAEANPHLSGNLVFDSETGSEGGWWAFQDQRFTGIPNDTLRCEHCGVYPETVISGPLKAVRSVSLGSLGPDFEMPPTCEEEDPPRAHVFTPAYPNGTWSYYGLHQLANGDSLIINDLADPARVVWSGQIHLGRTSNFSQSIGGLWIHNRQKGVDQEAWLDWFARGFPARLERAGTKGAAGK